MSVYLPYDIHFTVDFIPPLKNHTETCDHTIEVLPAAERNTGSIVSVCLGGKCGYILLMKKYTFYF